MFINDISYISKYGKLTQRKKSKLINSAEYTNTLIMLILQSIHCFKWQGLPESCNERMLELALIMNGTALIGRDPESSQLVSLIATRDGSLNLYGDPTGAYGYGLNGYNKHFELYIPGTADLYTLNKTTGEPPAVLCKDNKTMYPFVNYLTIAAARLCETQRSMDVITRMLKSPTMINCSQKDVQNVKQILEDINTNTPYILGLGSTPYETLQVLDLGAKPESLNALRDYKADLKSDIAELIGYNSNPATTKKERQLVSEIAANNEATSIMLKSRLETRQEFAKNCNDYFGTNISVNVNYESSDLEEEEKEEMITDDNYGLETSNITGINAQQREKWGNS